MSHAPAHVIESDHFEKSQKAEVVLRAKSLLMSKDPKVAALVLRANKALREKLLTPGQVHNDSTLSNLSIQYKNEDFIGLQLMPLQSVDKLSGKYAKYGKQDRLSAPDDDLGARARPNEISETRSWGNYSLKPRGLMDYVDATTLANQDAPLNEMVDLIAALNDVLGLKEEQRIASILTTAANFAGNTNTLVGTSQWSDFSGTSDPIKDVQNALAGIWSGYGATKLVGYCSLDVYNTLRRHPAVVDKFKYTQAGIPGLQALANLFDLDQILVGKAWQNTANKGQTAANSRVWGKHFGIVRVASGASTRTAMFGATMRMGEKKTSQWYDQTLGVDGGYYGKVAFHEDHVIIAPDTGWLIANAIA